jgi:hypothetical protein
MFLLAFFRAWLELQEFTTPKLPAGIPYWIGVQVDTGTGTGTRKETS